MATRDSETADDHLYAERYLSSENRLRTYLQTSFDRPNPHCSIVSVPEHINSCDLLTAIYHEVVKARSDAAESRLSDRNPAILVILRDENDVEKMEYIARTSTNHSYHRLYSETCFMYSDDDKFGRREDAVRFYNYRYRSILFVSEDCGFIDFLRTPNLVLWGFGPSFALSFFQEYNGVERVIWFWRNDLDDWQVLCGLASLYPANSFHMPTWISDIIGKQFFGTEQWERVSSHASHIHRRVVARRDMSFVIFPLRADEVPEFHDQLMNERLIIKSSDRESPDREPAAPGTE